MVELKSSLNNLEDLERTFQIIISFFNFSIVPLSLFNYSYLFPIWKSKSCCLVLFKHQSLVYLSFWICLLDHFRLIQKFYRFLTFASSHAQLLLLSLLTIPLFCCFLPRQHIYFFHIFFAFALKASAIVAIVSGKCFLNVCVCVC